MAELMRLDWPHHELWMLVSSKIERHWRVNACAKEPWTADWLRALGPDDVLLNVGACVGSYALPAAAQGAHVIAVEPNILNLARLCENVLANGLGERVTPLWGAVGVGLATVRYDDLSRGSASNPLVAESGPASLSVPCIDLRVYELTGAYVLIDVDGSEYAVLTRMRRSLRHVRSVLIEMQPDLEGACSKILKRAGLTLTARHTHRNGQPMGVVYAIWSRS